MSFIPEKPRRGQQSTARQYRVSPYPTRPTSHSSQVTNSGFLRSTPKSLSARALDRQTKKFQEAYKESIQAYTTTQLESLQAVREEVGWDSGTLPNGGLESSLDQHADSDWEDEPDDGFQSITLSIARRAGLHRIPQSWAERLDREHQSWKPEMDRLCDAILAFTRNGPPTSSDSFNASGSEPLETVSLLCIDLIGQTIRTFKKKRGAPLVQILARHGYIAPTASTPSCGIHVDLLRYCVALRRHASIASLQSIGAAICETLYSRHFRTQLSGALDVYLAVNRIIDARLAKIMGRDDPDWRLANACAACTYRLKDEPDLKYSIMFTCDGNDSLKRVANASVVDRRILNDDYFLPSNYVDRFENEVVRKKQAREIHQAHEGGDAEEQSPDVVHMEGSKTTSTDVSTGDQLVHTSTSQSDSNMQPRTAESQRLACEDRWKNAHADQEGRKVAVFDETGIFAVSCRHGSVMFVEDMRQSGELSKYGLAAVDKLARVFGDDILIGYDIGCTFSGTARRSPLVGPLVQKHNINFVVGSFHGYAHNRKCQLKNHPLNTEGAGLESFEENEHLFSSTNRVALTTRHASPFHRRQLIALRLSTWDFERRIALGSLLKSRYKSALEILNTLPKEIEKLSPGRTNDDWKQMHQAECKYFESLQAASPDSSFSMLYLGRLKVLAEKQKAYDDAFKIKIIHSSPSEAGAYGSGSEIQKTRQLETRRTAVTEQLLAIQMEVARMEEERGIHPRWQPGCAEWEAAMKRQELENYHEALRNLEALVVQRIAELERAHAIGTGYKARVHMSKAIKRREKAVHTALKRYNTAALALTPPRSILKFSELTEYAYLADFDFLKYSEHGALEADWSRPVNRRCVAAWQEIQRAKEEIIRLNIEIQRVRTHIRDEEDFLRRHCDQLDSSNSDLGCALRSRFNLTLEVNQRIIRDLDSLSRLKAYTGPTDCGSRITPLLSTNPNPDKEGSSDNQFELGNALAALQLQNLKGDPVELDDIEVEPSDEAQQSMIAIEDSCKVM